ncbi:MAG: saccharopine dehydrogenase NADP-binding domain-containing protein [Deltaproteobacteria bacterium]|nr:saccharopine dehydrogenase NADP-binding domain-containing protein [Deltaproteobacteria bacterium]
MSYKYLVLGSGMQGTAGGYDLAAHGDAESVVMADISLAQAQKAADWINRLLKKPIAKPLQLNAKDGTALRSAFKGINGIFSATSYELNLEITKAAIEAGASMVDLGGNTPVVLSQLKLHEQALAKNISIIPDCGLAPGLGNTLASYGISQMDRCDDVQVRCGGLPQTPRPPLDYKLVFSVRGLTNEYFGKAWVIRDEKIAEIETFSELEEIDFPKPIGRCEAFTTTGGTSTCPWTYQGKVKNFVYKTVRYPGHFEKIKCMMDLGLLDPDPIEVGVGENKVKVAPREVFHTVVPPRISFPEDKDLVVLRTTCTGVKNGKPMSVTYDLLDYHDEATGFSAMERSTAYPAALTLILSVRGKNKKGVQPLEVALDNETFMKEIGSHGLKISSLLR